ncbi:At2g23090 like protein [Rhodofomes roseus]|uniref:At2g23090 like protein n=1 Tax=Rhodofomes roseus TaxID=34475 RepID=A0ABQ8KEM9_9APHY|nr:At2g23090 like protein [Rhodofomes roseus]KAH9835768.1 At2g23090 like protein [Rhodofomes roseus]
MGNGAKAAQKRERNAAKAGGPAKSQLKTNQASMSIVCQTCKQAFMLTTRAPALEEHAKSKHTKTLAECFPTFGQ